MKRVFITILTLLVFLSGLSGHTASQTAQTAKTNSTDPVISFSDSQTPELDEWSQQKHPWIGIGGAIGFNLLLASWNRWAIGSAWAKTGPDEWLHFYERRLTWDRDWYWTNYVLHPYQGSMYYMSARGANLNRLEAFGVNVLGSSIWEFFCEKNAPSINDMVYTTIGSFCMGEMLFRLSQEVSSYEPFFGYFINPQRVWTQKICKIQQKSTSGRITRFDAGLSLGNVHAFAHINNVDRSRYPTTEIYPYFFMGNTHIVYRDPFTTDTNTPYDNFDLYIQAGAGKGSGYNGSCAMEAIDRQLFYEIRIFSDGVLRSRQLELGEDRDCTAGFGMIYDFDWHSYYMISSLAPSVFFKRRANYQQDKIEWQVHLGAILLGTTDYYYLHRKLIPQAAETTRLYNHNIGAENIIKFKYDSKKAGVFTIDFRGYAMYSFYNQLQKSTQTGWDFIGLLTTSWDYPITEKISVGVTDEVLGKIELINDMNDVRYLLNTIKFFGRYHIK